MRKLWKDWDVIYLGLAIWPNQREIYESVSIPGVKPFSNINSLGGFHGYLINRNFAIKVLSHINTQGIKLAIDNMIQKGVFQSDLKQLEVFPQMVFADNCYEKSDADSDIQRDQRKLIN